MFKKFLDGIRNLFGAQLTDEAESAAGKLVQEVEQEFEGKLTQFKADLKTEIAGETGSLISTATTGIVQRLEQAESANGTLATLVEDIRNQLSNRVSEAEGKLAAAAPASSVDAVAAALKALEARVSSALEGKPLGGEPAAAATAPVTGPATAAAASTDGPAATVHPESKSVYS
jgi:hypothetical protein